MLRLWAIALLLIIPQGLGWAQAGWDKGKDKEFKVEGALADGDPKDKKTNTAAKVHSYKMTAGSAYVIRMNSTEVDAYLRLEDATGKELAENDDEEETNTFNARIVFKCDKDGDYKIICTSFPKPVDPKLKLTGKYTLIIEKAAKADQKKLQSKTNPHDMMVNNPAPKVPSRTPLHHYAVPFLHGFMTSTKH